MLLIVYFSYFCYVLKRKRVMNANLYLLWNASRFLAPNIVLTNASLAIVAFCSDRFHYRFYTVQ